MMGDTVLYSRSLQLNNLGMKVVSQQLFKQITMYKGPTLIKQMIQIKHCLIQQHKCRLSEVL